MASSKNYEFNNIIGYQVIVRVFKKGYPDIKSKYVIISISSTYRFLSKKSFIKFLHHYTKYSLEIVTSVTMDKVSYDIYDWQIEETFSNLKLGYYRVSLKEVREDVSLGKIELPADFYIKGVVDKGSYTFFHIENSDLRVMLTPNCIAETFEKVGLNAIKCKDTAPHPNSYFLADKYKIVECPDGLGGESIYEVFRVETKVIKEGEEFVEV